MIPRLLVAAVVLVLVTATAGCQDAGRDRFGSFDAAGAPEPTRVPAGPPKLVGAAVLPALPVAGPQEQSFRAFDRIVGATTRLAHQFRTWDVPLVPPGIDEVVAAGRTPVLSWNVSDIVGVADGRHDERIAAEARSVAAAGVPVLLRFRWEMDRPNLRASVVDPATYVAAWERAHRIFTEAGATNAAWVWCPTARGFGPDGDAAAFYPGDEDVDWVCADAYTEDTPDEPLADLMGPFMHWAAGHDKPVMVGEFGVDKRNSDRGRARWIRRAASWLSTQPTIRAVVYFSLDVDPDAPVLQYDLPPGSRAAAAFGALVRRLQGAP